MADHEDRLANLSGGKQPDSNLVGVINQIFSSSTAEHAYEIFQQRDALAGALTGNRSQDSWQAWRQAKMLVSKSRPREGLDRLQNLGKLHPLDANSASMADAERLALMAQIYSDGNQSGAALRLYDDARAVMLNFIEGLESGPEEASDEICEMLRIVVGVQGLENLESEVVLGAWSAARGLDFFLAIAQGKINTLDSIHAAGVADNIEIITDQLLDDIVVLHRFSGTAFGTEELAHIEFVLGDCKTHGVPADAFKHFESVVQLLGVEHSLGLQAAINAANCLLRTGRFSEAESRYASLESLFEYRGDYRGAARVWMSESIASWKQKQDPGVRHGVIGAIKMYEDNLPPDTDIMTRYTQKKFIEQAYTLLITANCYDFANDASDERIDETLSAVWALMSRDLLADFESEDHEASWNGLLTRSMRPLAATKAMLSPLPGVGIVHTISGIDCLVWIVYGFSSDNEFRFEMCHFSEDQIAPFIEFLQLLTDQLEADKARDDMQVNAMNGQLQKLGNKLGKQLTSAWTKLAKSMEHLFYMPHPYGNIDEFPLAGLRIGGKWLYDYCTITRAPTINHLRELLSPNRPAFRGNRNAVVVVGNPEIGGPMLRGAVREAEAISTTYLPAFGFDTELSQSADSTQMIAWTNGDVGALHYVGHGIANPVSEALPLAQGDDFTISQIDRIDGSRTPFVFLCACVAGRIRSGAGGYQAGITSKLVERNAPAALAFTLPVPETRAYELTHQFYRQAYDKPLGQAVTATRVALREAQPNYMWLALAAYGDPSIDLRKLHDEEGTPLMGHRAVSWNSLLRNHCVLRTQSTESSLAEKLDEAPASLRPLLEEWLGFAFQPEPDYAEKILDEFEERVFAIEDCSDLDRLCLRAAICAERAHKVGLEEIPLYIPTDSQSIRRLFDDALFIARLGGAFFDMRLNGLGNTLLGRVITVDQNGIANSSVYLKQGQEKLLECEDDSPFVKQLRDGNKLILRHFGG